MGWELQDRAFAGAVASEVLDEWDHPVLLFDGSLRARFANKLAAVAAGRAPLAGLQLATRGDHDGARLGRAVDAAVRQRLRALLTLAAGSADEAVVSVVPLRAADGSGAAMLILPKSRVCEELTLDCWARHRSLTPVETRVLRAIADGASPDGIAQQHGVALSTVRTQIGTLRAKLGAKDLRALTRQVALLPPLVPALRGAP